MWAEDGEEILLELVLQINPRLWLLRVKEETYPKWFIGESDEGS